MIISPKDLIIYVDAVLMVLSKSEPPKITRFVRNKTIPAKYLGEGIVNKVVSSLIHSQLLEFSDLTLIRSTK